MYFVFAGFSGAIIPSDNKAAIRRETP